MFLYSKWLALPINIRHDIANKLDIKKKVPTHVQDNVIVSDGYAIKDVEAALTVQGLQTYLGVGTQEDDFETLWEMIANPTAHNNIVVNQSDVIVPKKKGGRPKGSKNKHEQETTTGK